MEPIGANLAKGSLQLSDSKERETGIEPATSSLGSWHSTAELLPLIGPHTGPNASLIYSAGIRLPRTAADSGAILLQCGADIVCRDFVFVHVGDDHRV